MRRTQVILVGLMVTVSVAHAADDSLALRVALVRAGEYVASFEQDLAGIVAEEHYVQQVVSGSLGTRSQAEPPRDPRVSRRELRSDLLLVQPTGTDRYVQFRDVYEVDSEQVRDRDERLLKLFIRTTSSSISQAARIMAESARYNVGWIDRTVNVPVLPLSFLKPAYQRRFRFSGKLVKTADAALIRATGSDATTPIEVWVVEYRENEPHTLIRTTAAHDLPSHGRFWIQPASGRVLMTELIAEDAMVHAKITVTYGSSETLGFLVPVEMDEAYWQSGVDQRISGNARYSNFRRFTVTTEESIVTPNN
jgi:hypothetical protein